MTTCGDPPVNMLSMMRGTKNMQPLSTAWMMNPMPAYLCGSDGVVVHGVLQGGGHRQHSQGWFQDFRWYGGLTRSSCSWSGCLQHSGFCVRIECQD